MKRILTLLVAFCCLSSTDIHAGSLQVAQWMPWKFIQNELAKNAIEFDVQESAIQMDIQGVRPVARGVHFYVAGDLSKLSIGQNGIEALSENLKAKISIQELAINQIIVRNISGNLIRLHVHAKCSPLQIEIPQFSTYVRSSFVEDASSFRPELHSLEIDIPHSGWSMSSFECSGLGGLGPELENLVTNALNDPKTFEPFLNFWLKDQIQKSWIQTWNAMLGANSQIQLLYMSKPTDSGVMIYGALPLKLNRDISLPEIQETTLSRLRPQLILSSEGFSALLEDKFTTLAPQKYNLQKVSGFQELMKSRFKQYMVWPDLQRFHSTSPFLLSYYPHQSRFQMKANGNQTWGVQFNSNGVVQTLISQSPLDYLNWGLVLKTQVNCEVKGSVLKLKTGKVQMDVAWAYSLLYQMIYRPNQRIALSLLKGVLESSFSNQEISQDLPTLNFHNREWKLQNWSQNNQLITMDWIEETL